ncbi:MAG: laccase domain-containing protein [Phycisphaerae bacterium]|nr:laccase domain-containing protein [Phycisphaerae bacterium]
MDETRGWRIEEVGGVPLARSAMLGQVPALVHGFTLAGFNMSLKTGPDPAGTPKRREQLCQALGLDFAKLTGAVQVHGAEIIPVDETLAGAGRDGSVPPIPHVDGFVTDTRGIVLMGMSADCPILLAYDPARPAIGVVHAGWRGTIACIALRLVGVMERCFGSKAADLRVAIAPCAGREEFEVKEDVVRLAAARWDGYQMFFPQRDGRTFFDLRSTNVGQLTAAGVRPEHIDVAEMCTIRDERFNSFRRDGAATGHAALLAALV